MDDLKNNWFYKLCVKQCIKDTVWLVLGIFFLILAVYSIDTQGGILSLLLFIVLSVVMILIWADSVFVKLPKIRRQLSSMTFNELERMGQEPPPCMFRTLYFTDGFLLSPYGYRIIPYDIIANVNVRSKVFRGRVTGGYADIEFNDGTPDITLAVNDRKFIEKENEFKALIEQHRTWKG